MKNSIEIMRFSDLVEENGRPIRENNMLKEHKFRIGDIVNTFVEINHSRDERTSVQLSGYCKLFVVGCHRDCDGTPLYTLADIPVVMPSMVRAEELMKYVLFSKLQLPSVGEDGLAWTGVHSRIFDSVQEWMEAV